jgi:hypothetical protein
MNPVNVFTTFLLALLATTFALPSIAEESEAEIAKKSQNPIAAMYSLPMQLNYDSNIGPARQGSKWYMNVQPVIPVSISTDWNMISRTIVPLVSQENVAPAVGTKQTGIGDITQSFFFSPKALTESGWTWGAGPVILLPTGVNGVTAHKTGLGPTAVALKQENGWTYGALVNQIWSVAGDSQYNDVSAAFVQPFLAFTTKTYTTFGVNSESTYNWKTSKWSVPVNFTATQLLRVHGQLISVLVGARYWADTPTGVGPEAWGFRMQLTLLFPR